MTKSDKLLISEGDLFSQLLSMSRTTVCRLILPRVSELDCMSVYCSTKPAEMIPVGMATTPTPRKAMQIAKAYKCREYDMFGVAPNPDPSHPMYGLFKFKQGFGGNMFHQLGCWDYPLDFDKYKYFSACEMNMRGYYDR